MEIRTTKKAIKIMQIFFLHDICLLLKNGLSLVEYSRVTIRKFFFSENFVKNFPENCTARLAGFRFCGWLIRHRAFVGSLMNGMSIR